MSNINLTFVKDGGRVSVQALSSDMFAEIVLKYITKTGINSQNVSFLYNSNPIKADSFKSLSELNIANGATIQVVQAGQFNPKIQNNSNNQNYHMNLCFTLSGRNIIVQGTPNMKFSELTSRFHTKAGIEEGQEPSFLLNSRQIDKNDSRTLAELNLRDQAKIDVVLVNLVIGA